MEIIVGKGSPQILNKGAFKSSAEARLKAQSLLQRANTGSKSGTLIIPGEILYSGGIINIVNSLADDGEYSISKTTHNLNLNGWETSIEFEN